MKEKKKEEGGEEGKERLGRGDRREEENPHRHSCELHAAEDMDAAGTHNPRRSRRSETLFQNVENGPRFTLLKFHVFARARPDGEALGVGGPAVTPLMMERLDAGLQSGDGEG